MFGTLPASGSFLRHAKNIEFSNIEIATEKADARPAFWAEDVDGLDLFRIRVPSSATAFALQDVQMLRTFGSRDLKDKVIDTVDHIQF